MNLISALIMTSIALFVGLPGGVVQVTDDPYLIDFSSPKSIDGWRVVNDGVMGGLSQSRITATSSGTAVFEGHLSLERNGGFASVRALLDAIDLSDRDGILVRARGDGRTYQIRFRTDQRFDGVTYRATFPTKSDQWETVKVPFTAFKPTYRGRILSGVEPMNTSRLRQIAFMVADKKEGPFRLEIDWVKASVWEKIES